MYAIRNIRLCTKDCACLFVCPTGATDTENGQIDKDKCLDGCRRCVDACPSHAISLVMDNYPEHPPKKAEVRNALLAFMDRKYAEELQARALASATKGGTEATGVDKAAGTNGARLAKALAVSLRTVAEDCAREADFLIPQGRASRQLLQSLLDEKPQMAGKAFPEAEIQELMNLLQ
jgi:Fe-S-cluster-containing hydrogenase component 2